MPAAPSTRNIIPLLPAAAGGDVVVTPTSASVTFDAPAPTAKIQAAPPSATATFSAPAPVAAVKAAPPSATATFSAAAPAAKIVALPNAALVTFDMPPPSVGSPLIVFPTPGTVTFSMPTPSVAYQSAPPPATVTFSAAPPTAKISAAPSVATVTFDVPAPILKYAVASPPATVTFSAAAPTVSVSTTPTPATVTFSMPVPTISGVPIPGFLEIVTPSIYDRAVVSMSGNVKMILATYTFSNSYTTGGEDFKLPPLAQNVIWVGITGKSGYVFVREGAKLKAYRSPASAGPLTEVPAATDLSALGPIDLACVTY